MKEILLLISNIVIYMFAYKHFPAQKMEFFIFSLLLVAANDIYITSKQIEKKV